MNKPLIRWFGGKGRLIPKLMARLPANFDSSCNLWVEPFAGGGAMFLHVLSECPNIKEAVINDLNPHLINYYLAAREDPQKLHCEIEHVKQEFLSSLDYKTFYYNVLRARFNNNILAGWQLGGAADFVMAANFYVLNATCFNGFWRVNKRGMFNATFGFGDGSHHRKEIAPSLEELRGLAALLERCTIMHGDFERTFSYSCQGSFFYLDPPYVPISKTSNFTTYTCDGFTEQDQARLVTFMDQLSARGVPCMVSNSSAAASLYHGYRVDEIEVMRTVAGDANARGNVTEIVAMNYD